MRKRREKLRITEADFMLANRRAPFFFSPGVYPERENPAVSPTSRRAVIILTAAAALLAIWLCSKTDKNSAKLLK